MTYDERAYADLDGTAMAPEERFSDRERYERAIRDLMRASAHGPDWAANELVLTDVRLEGAYPDTGLRLEIASALTGEPLLDKGFYIWHDAGRVEHSGGVTYRATPRFYVRYITTRIFEALIIRPDK
ncbi:MAG TPA: hypothetical protein VI300_01245 [Solirubrobacter sp.]